MKVVNGYGLPWIEPEDYPAMRDLLHNPANLPLDYQGWVALFVESSEKVSKAGFTPLKVKTNADLFTAWCFLRKRDVTSENLYPFAAEKGWGIANAGG